MKIAVVDDNRKRNSEIKRLLMKECKLSEDCIVPFFNTQDIKNSLRAMHFDIMILDVILPRRDERASAKTSFNLLNDIDNNIKLKKPDSIIGITASTDDIHEFKSKFEQRCLTVIEATNSNKSWKEKIVKAVNYKKDASLAKGTSESNIYCYSVHGIRTRGKWQQDLKKVVEQNIDNVEFGSYKYGYFSIATFFIPLFRLPVVYRFSKELEEILRKNEDKRVILFSHSFGTFILIKALEKIIKKKEYKNISTIVLSGSVLRKGYNFKKLQQKTNARIINDCGSSDYILSLSEAFIPFAGMAGKVGFRGTNDKYFVNRYFTGGHSHYFDEKNDFIKRYWLPLFAESHEVELIDNRKDSFLRLGLLDKSTSFLGAIKEIIYTSLIVYYLYFLI
jgi:CheY-like chemotaxis protein